MSSYSLSVKPIEEYTSAVIAGIVRIISVAALLALVLVLVTCGSGFNFDGTWKGNRNLPPLPDEQLGLSRTLGEVELKIEAGRFELQETSIPFRGTVRYEDGKAILTIDTRFDTPVEKEPKEIQEQIREIVITPREDGKVEYVNPASAFPEPLALEREVKKKS